MHMHMTCTTTCMCMHNMCMHMHMHMHMCMCMTMHVHVHVHALDMCMHIYVHDIHMYQRTSAFEPTSRPSARGEGTESAHLVFHVPCFHQPSDRVQLKYVWELNRLPLCSTRSSQQQQQYYHKQLEHRRMMKRMHSRARSRLTALTWPLVWRGHSCGNRHPGEHDVYGIRANTGPMLLLLCFIPLTASFLCARSGCLHLSPPSLCNRLLSRLRFEARHKRVFHRQ